MNTFSNFSQSTQDCAHAWLNENSLAYGNATEAEAEKLLIDACQNIVSVERDEAARIAKLKK